MREATIIARLTLALVAAAASCGGGCSSAAPNEDEVTGSSNPTDPGAAPGTGTGAGAETGSGSDGSSRRRLAPSYDRADINHVLGTGQSLSLGMMGTPPLSTTQPFGNVMFDTGLTPSATSPSAFVPLLETSTALEVPVETPSSGMANLVSMLSRDVFGEAHDLLVSLHGQSGASYPMIRKGTAAYENGIAQVRTAREIAERAGKTYAVRAITVVHGESDGWQNWNQVYDRAMLEWQTDYSSDIRALTGQSTEVPMFHSQYSGWTPVEAASWNVIPIAQLEAHKAAPGRIVLVGPKYFLPYADDGFHLTNEGYRWLGEYYAKAYVRHVLEGGTWEPVRPREITRRGDTVTVRFHVPSPPLVLDIENVADPGSFGFSIHDDGLAPPSITNVAVTGPDRVTITLSGEPTGASPRLRYAFDGSPGKPSGPSSGARGNLRDSDDTPSRSRRPLYNWCVHFDEPLP